MNKNWLIALAVGSGLAALFVVLRVFKNTAEKVGDTIASPIADAYLAVTLPGPVRVNASVRLPSGELVDATNLSIKDDFSFKWNSRLYRLTARGKDNIYGSVLI